MIDISDLERVEYRPEVADCFQCTRKYFAKLDIHITDYAHPSDWAAFNGNLFEKHYEEEGFIRILPQDWKPQLHDLMGVRGFIHTPHASHLGVLARPNGVLHHYTGRLSEVTPFKGVWRTPALVLRHKDVTIEKSKDDKFQITDLMTDHARRQFERAAELAVQPPR